MRPQHPTHWLLDGHTGWRTTRATGLAAGEHLRLSAEHHGPLGFGAEDGSLGGLVLPVGVALGPGGPAATCYLLDPAGRLIRRFDPLHEAFRPVLGGTPPGGADPCRHTTALGAAVNIAIAGDLLYVADRHCRRLLAFGLPHLELRHLWTGYADLADVTSDGTAAYLLDRARARVWRHVPGQDRLRLVVEDTRRGGRLHRVAVDREGLVHLYDPAAGRLHRYDRHGRAQAVFTDPEALRDRFPAPPIRLAAGVFVLPTPRPQPGCDRQSGPAGQSADYGATAEEGPAFDRTGRPRPRTRPRRGPQPYARQGTWTGPVLDSRIYRCVWDRIELDLTALPVGTTLTVETATFDQPPPDPDTAQWDPAGTLTGRAQPPGAPPQAEAADWPVRSRPGRHLAIRLHMTGPGWATPLVRSLRLRYPRSSYLEYLPAVYRSDADGKDFLERFLSALQATWDGIEEHITDLPRYVDPAAVPAGAPMRYLAGWLGIPLDASRPPQHQRRWLQTQLAVRRRRGTPAALRALLAAALADRPPTGPGETGYPVLVEGFRTRHHLALGRPAAGTVGAPLPLWSPRVTDRLHLGADAEVGRARLVSTADPGRDVFTTTADTFRVYLPSAWVRTAEDERAVHRLLAAEKPATSRYELCLVEPRLRVATQSTVGVDTVLGQVPTARLACRHTGQAPPPSRPPRHRLGLDSVLAAAAPDRLLRVGAGTVIR